MPKFILMDSKLSKDVEEVLNEVGIDMDTVIKMTLKRIVRDRSIAFLTAGPVAAPAEEAPKPERKITKNQAVSLFEAKGVRFSRNITFASKNRGAHNYWANPDFGVLETDWYLILNDWMKRELHLFVGPGNALRPEDLVCRGDQHDRIDLQICYDDPTYTDNRSKVHFARFLVRDLKY